MAETIQQAQRRMQASAIRLLEQELTTAHLDSFPPARRPLASAPALLDEATVRRRVAEELGLIAAEQELQAYGVPPVAPAPEPVDARAMVAERTKSALRQVPLIRLGERRDVRARIAAEVQKEAAEEESRRHVIRGELQARLDSRWEEVGQRRIQVARRTAEDCRQERQRREDEHLREQQELDQEWERLSDNDPETVNARLALEVGSWVQSRSGELIGLSTRGAETTLLISVKRPEELVPDQRADTTPTGRPTVKKRSQTDRNQLYLETVGSTVLGAVRCGFANAPSLSTLAVLALMDQGLHLGIAPRPIYFGRFDRGQGDLDSEDPGVALDYSRDALMNVGGRTDELRPIDLSDEPGVEMTLSSALGAVR